ncbi:murein L,D-transpeptidase catalytic domain family protein [Capnocytophaga cynodegmi]|uniref:murein L,D-transpeptidase catalytic domain family protein n=1 Tax=Capnocytophaga cynodegmi TaxID=28189 RepID=UPI00385AB106
MNKIFRVICLFILSLSTHLTKAENIVFESISDSINSKEYVTLALKKMETNIKDVYDEIGAEEYDLNFEAFRYAYIGYQSLRKQQRLNDKEIFSIIDFSKDCNTKRFYTIDLENKQIIYNTYVAHGKKSGEKNPTSFSNIKESNKSSIGFYITGKTYMGSRGFSLQLHGDEKGYNSNMAERGVVIHTADYASEDYIKKNGRMGRSLGCPVLPKDIYKQVIETIKEKTMIFAYYNNPKYLSSSKYLNVLKLIEYSML